MLCSEFGYSRQEIFDETERLVQIAAEYNGVVFGGYVRDIIIPLKKLNRNLEQLDFKDLDFWFQSKSNAERFIAVSGLTPGQHETFDNPSGHYPVCRNQHLYHYKGKPFVIVDVMITDFYPVCDFSVNLVSWDGYHLKVNKPYDIVSQVVRDLIQKDEEISIARNKLYTIEEIHLGLKLHFPQRNSYTVDDLKSYTDKLFVPLTTPLTENERKLYLLLIKDYHPKTYTLEQIVEQIKWNVYDTSRSFLWMSQNGSTYSRFYDISLFVARRIDRFKTKVLGGQFPQPNLF